MVITRQECQMTLYHNRIKEKIEIERAKFIAKPVIQLTTKNPILFNGALYTLTSDGIIVTQPSHCKNLSLIPHNDPNEYTIQRARGAYISSVCQPQAAFDFSQAA